MQNSTSFVVPSLLVPRRAARGDCARHGLFQAAAHRRRFSLSSETSGPAQSIRSRGRPPAWAAFVLLELLIVLAVLASVAAICWPTVSSLLAKSELQSAAKQVRAALARARLDAMEADAVRQFRYQPGTGRFEIGRPDSPAGDEASRDEAAGSPVEESLPSGVRFEALDDAAELPAVADPDAALDEQNWSAPVRFFPNGRTSNARIRLIGRRDCVVQVSLRGAVGAVTIGKIEQREPTEALP